MRGPETKTAKAEYARAVVVAPFPLTGAPCGKRKPWSFARCAGDAGRRPNTVAFGAEHAKQTTHSAILGAGSHHFKWCLKG